MGGRTGSDADDRCLLGQQILGNAELGRDRPDVARAFRNYPEAGRSGFVFVAQRTPNTIDVAAGLRIIATTCSGHSKIFNVSLAKIASRTEAFNYLRDGLSNNPESYAEVARSFSVAGRFDDAEAILTEAVENSRMTPIRELVSPPWRHGGAIGPRRQSVGSLRERDFQTITMLSAGRLRQNTGCGWILLLFPQADLTQRAAAAELARNRFRSKGKKLAMPCVIRILS